MENPRVVSRCLLVVLAVGTVTAAVVSICCRDYYLLLLWLACLGVFLISCILLAFVNVLIFVPIFWLMSRLTLRIEKRPIGNSLPNNDHPHSPPSSDHRR
jgi:hypothetical protein